MKYLKIIVVVVVFQFSIFNSPFSILHAQPDYIVSGFVSHTMPNSDEWSYISDYGTGVDFAVRFSQLWCWRYGDTSRTLIREPYNMGVRTNFTYYPNDIAGHRIAVAPFIQTSLLRRESHSLLFGFDVGLACFTKPFSRTPDAQNVFIGSYINCMIQFGLVYEYQFKNNSALSLYANFAHSSNGYIQKPNKGLNYMQLQLGYHLPRKMHSPELLSDCNRLVLFDSVYYIYLPVDFDSCAFSRHDMFFSVAPGFVRPRDSRIENRFFYAYTARVGWQYHFNIKRAVGANIDITYNGTHDKLRDMEPVDYKLPFYVGLCGNYEATWHKLSLHIGVAYYLLRSWHQHGKYYERVGLFYNFGDDVTARTRHFVGVSLKAHAAHVDFIEWHYGVKIR